MSQWIDPDVTRAQFAALDPHTAKALADAMQGDFIEWGDRLVAAAAANDAEAMARARHALAGLCGNFGAGGLMALADGGLDDGPDRIAFLHARDAAVAEILAESVSAARG